MSDTLLSGLSNEDLRHLAAQLRAGQVGLPATEVALQRFLSSSKAAAAATVLSAFPAAASAEVHAAAALELLVAERERLGLLVDAVDLVTTGPEGPGIANRDTAVVVRQLFQDAKESLLLAGFAVYRGRDVFKSLADAMDARPGLKVQMFLDIQRAPGDTTGVTDLELAFAAQFKKKHWPGARLPEVHYDPRSLEIESADRATLHAKCIVVDRAVAFVTSANFTPAAQEKNIEVGVLIRHPGFAVRLQRHFERLLEAGVMRRVPGL